MSTAIEQVKSALLILAGVCDGATKRDNVGFNGTDSNFGRSLARQVKEELDLTPKQLESACKMLQKYKLTQLKGLTIPSLQDLKKEMEELNSNAVSMDDDLLPVEKIKKALLIVFEKGFLPHDQMFGRSLVSQITANRKLSEKQCELSLKLLDRYKHLVTDLPSVDDVKKQFLLENNSIREALEVRELGIVETGITISFSVYNATFVNMIKSIYPNGEFISQRNKKFWLFSFSSLEKICKLFLPFGFKITDELKDYISQIEFEKYEKDLEAQEMSEFINEFIEREMKKWSFKPFQHQLEAVQMFSKVKKGILADQQGLGKALVNSTPILTPEGFVNISDIQVGDLVIGSNGEPTEVWGVFPQGKVNIYRITFSDGSTVDCCEDHQWFVEERINSYKQVWKTLTTKQMINKGLIIQKACKYRIPMVDPVEFFHQNILIDPYAMGYLLGNGCFAGGSLKVSTQDNEIIKYFSSILPDSIFMKQNSKYDWTISTGNNGGKIKNIWLNYIKKLDFKDKLANLKFIPNEYKFNTFEIRLALFQGLMDSDGSFAKSNIRNSGNLEYSSSSKQLALDVKFLVESFGGIARLSEKDSSFTYKGEQKDGQKHYRLTISLPSKIIPFRLKRKLKNYIPRTKYQPTRLIKSIEFIGVEEATCISVSALDSLYVIKDCIVTHNTKSALMLYKALQAYYWETEYKELPIFVICPVSLKINWLNEAKSLDVSIEVFSSAKIPSSIKSDFLVIVDEAHYFQNLEAKRTQKYLELVTDEKCKHLLEMTGTPMKNGRPINLYPLLKACDHPVAKDKKAYEKFFCDAKATHFSKWDVTGSSHLKELSEEISDILLRRTKEECLDLPEKIIQNVICESTKERINEYNNRLNDLKKEYFERVSKGLISDNGRAIVFLGYLRTLASVYKTYHAIQMIKDLLDQDESVVVFTEFLESAEMIAEEFDTIPLTGSLKPESRQELVDNFQSGENKVFVGTIKAGGVGITLTRASYIIIIDLPWTPGDLEQAEDRIHRIGQTRTANVYRLFGQDICWIMAGIIGQKQENINQVLKKYNIDINKKDSDSFFKDLLEKLMKKS